MSAAPAPIVLPASTVTVTLSTADALRAGEQMRTMAHTDRAGCPDGDELFARVGAQLVAAAMAGGAPTSTDEGVEPPAADTVAPTALRIAITGGPKAGKTTLARKLLAQLLSEHPRTRVYHTDDLMDLDWSVASQHITDHCLGEPGPWIMEGVAVSRALRKWSKQHPGERPPVDRVIYLTDPHEPLTPRQGGMAKSVATVHSEIEAWLAEHGLKTERTPTRPATDESAPALR